MLDQLKIFFIEENNLNIHNYKSYSDLSGLTIEQLWTHANEYGYKEQRQIFNDCHYNKLFYDYYLADYRKIVLSNHPTFDWRLYNITSEYYALIDYISKCDLSYNETTDISYTNPHYSLIAECPNYDYLKFPFAYGSGQWSSSLYGIIIPCKSIMKRGYFMYMNENEDEYLSSTLSDEYDMNEGQVKIRLDLYVNGIQSEYYIEETLDLSRNMLGALFKKKNINGPTIVVDYDHIILEENSVISWFCSDLLGKTIDGEYTNYPYNPSRNRFIMILEPYNTRFVSNSLHVLKNELDLIQTKIDLNKHNITLKQNKLIVGNNIEIVDNIISTNNDLHLSTIATTGDVFIGDKLDRKQNIVCRFNGNAINLNDITSYKLDTINDTNHVDFLTYTSGNYTFSRAGLYKVNAHAGVVSLFYNDSILCRLMPTLNDISFNRFPVGYGYIRGTNFVINKCSCDITFMLNINQNDYISFVLEQSKNPDGTFGSNMLNTQLMVQSVMFEYLGS